MSYQTSQQFSACRTVVSGATLQEIVQQPRSSSVIPDHLGSIYASRSLLHSCLDVVQTPVFFHLSLYQVT
ncbi:hypothetical protein M404DRAFT_505113 [Pisolithus tinctorius Marx 270]|uniref:Uncharacterized protein n=1 Tax=Pisolithus tinctorius Marx 270 TaxID=870435 RepID=A0A0C3PCS8_PISTI|nr:hypothetical protein M404DRAFT_505113 [Pisolithus tinctorius Marx 270]